MYDPEIPIEDPKSPEEERSIIGKSKNHLRLLRLPKYNDNRTETTNLGREEITLVAGAQRMIITIRENPIENPKPPEEERR
jgi:hypothetical protein